MRTEAPTAPPLDQVTTAPPRTRADRWVRPTVIAMAVVAFAVAIAGHRWLFPLLSGDHDEPVYRFQAQMMLHGQLSGAKDQAFFFRPWLSGSYHGHIVLAFAPGWPLLLAISQAVFRSMIVAVGLSAAAAIVATYAFAREVLDDDHGAVLASAIVLASPFFLILGATYLSYTVALALDFFCAWAVVRGVRTGVRWLWIVAGALAGFTFATRTFDIFVFAVPLAGYVAWTLRHQRRALLRNGAWFALGALPFVVAMLVVNTATTGHWSTFSIPAQSNETSRFFFGNRSIAPDTPVTRYTVKAAWISLETNLHPMWTWVAGTFATGLAAIYGTVRLWARRRAIAVLLVAMVAAFPIGYFFWWASQITTPGARNGLGPHYYLPMLPALAVLAAFGFVEAWRRWRAVTAAAVAVGLVLTCVAAVPKAQDKLDLRSLNRAYQAKVASAAATLGSGKRIVVLERHKSPYVMEPYAYLANDPQLHNEVLYATYRGADLADLVRRFPDRRAGRLVRQYGGSLKNVGLLMEPLRFASGASLRASVHVSNPAGGRYVLVYASANGETLWHMVDTTKRAATPRSAPVDTTLELSASGMRFAGGGGSIPMPRRGTLSIGMVAGNEIPKRDISRAEHRYDMRVVRRDGAARIDLLLADEQWVRFASVDNWLPLNVTKSIAVTWR